MLQSLLDLLFSEKTLAVLIVGALGFLGKAVVSLVHRRRIALAAYHAFHFVEDLAAEVDDGGSLDKTLDKVEAGLAEVDRYFRLNGWRAPKSGDKELIAAHFSAIHGAELAKVKVQIKAEETLFPQ